MGGAYDKAHAHYAFVAAAIVLLAISWHVSTSPSSLAADSPAFAAAVDVLERAAAAPLPGVALALVVGPGLPAPRDGAWASLELSWPEHVRLASARHWDGARDRGLPASPAAVVPAVDPWSGAPGTFELVAGCWSSLGPALVLGASRRAWAFLPCDGPSADLPSAVAAVGRALGAAVFDVSAAAAERGGSFGVGPTAEGLFYVAAFELAIEGPSGTGRWAFGDAAAALLSPALARLAPALRLRVTSRVTPTAPLAAAPLAASAAVPPAPVYDFESLPPRVATLGDLASALVHGPAASLAPRDQFPSGAVLMYTLAVLPHSNRPPLVLRSSERNGHGGFTASVLHVDDPYSTTVVVLRPMNASVEGADGAGLPAASLAPVFAAFLGRLRGGLGLPPASHCPAGSGVLTSCLLPSEGFRGWEVDRVARDVAQRSRLKLQRRAAQVRGLVADGALLAKDAVEWEAVADEVRSLMAEAPGNSASSLGRPSGQAAAGPADVGAAVARRGEALSELLLRAATLVPTEVEFPLEHLLAVYLPMWMPLAMPLLIGLLKPPAAAAG